MTRTQSARLAVLALVSVAALAIGGESKKFDKSVPFRPEESKLGLKVDNKVTIESVRVRHWPDPDDFRKAEKDLNDKHTMFVEFTYSNRDLDTNYKCRYDVTITGPGGTLAHDDRTATLDKGKIGDTNKMMLKMRTNEYKTAKTMKVSVEVWRKD
jgi:hypothetical protein